MCMQAHTHLKEMTTLPGGLDRADLTVDQKGGLGRATQRQEVHLVLTQIVTLFCFLTGVLPHSLIYWLI